MRVDIIIPTYNRCKLLERALISALGQSYSNIRVVVLDNGSSDETSDMISSYIEQDNRLKYIKSSMNEGMLKNLWNAFDTVDSDFFAILTDDDVLALDFVSNSTEILLSDPDLGFVALNSTWVTPELQPIKPTTHVTNAVCKYKNEHAFISMVDDASHFSLISCLFRKDLKQLYLETDCLNDLGSDIRFLYHAAAKYNWATLDSHGAFVTFHEDSFSISKPIINWAHDVRQLTRYLEIIDFNLENDIIVEKCLEKIAQELSFSKSRQYFLILIKKILYAHILNPKDLSKIEVDIKEFQRAANPLYKLTIKLFYNLSQFRSLVIILRKLSRKINLKKKLFPAKSKNILVPKAIHDLKNLLEEKRSI